MSTIGLVARNHGDDIKELSKSSSSVSHLNFLNIQSGATIKLPIFITLERRAFNSDPRLYVPLFESFVSLVITCR